MKDITVYDSNGNSLTEVVQWDTDVIVCIQEDDILKNYKVHFFNSESDIAYAVQGVYENGVLKARIPNRLLWQPYIILGYVHVEENGEGKAMYRFRINMCKKPQPSNYFYDGTKDYIEATEILKECKEEAAKSSNYSTNSKSWAVGSTGTRTGENTDNSKYYSEQSKAQANTATSKANAAAASAAEAIGFAATATEKATEAQSWAVGYTDTRSGENTNNSKYYSEQSASSKNAAKASETNAKNSETNAKAAESNTKKYAEYVEEVAIGGVVMIGATDTVDGVGGFAPKPMAGDNEKYLRGDGTWSRIPELVVLRTRDRNSNSPKYW